MKSTLKNIVDEAIENAVASSSVVNLLLNSVKLIANEMKKMADAMLKLNERLNQHEKAIEILCDLQKEKVDFVEQASPIKTSSKPN